MLCRLLSCGEGRTFSSFGVRASHLGGLSWCGAWAQITGSVVVVRRLNCSVVCGIFPDQASSVFLPLWQVESLPLLLISLYRRRPLDVQELSQVHKSIASRFLPCRGFPGGTSGKEPADKCRRRKRLEFDPWVGKIPWRKKWLSTPVSMPGESHGQINLAGYGPQGHRVRHD